MSYRTKTFRDDDETFENIHFLGCHSAETKAAHEANRNEEEIVDVHHDEKTGKVTVIFEK
jgi:hypothetical protein